ncbi:hypothetical protein LB572_24615 [Mesorhizobium sp. BH1-1-5]|uniref:hypothetical protein n=1 Tax=Mesorhizobium sp. BH1-1-5 TaxID=2876661 RepID=UPI00112BA644|nr:MULTISPECIES: hypothetical protein [unclassified Mesorhizobium]MBZ9990287.1 hypothetical protein [Mesorhizobium sp. BH1-1-5]TPJ54579.1 hypothetical protein FJ471_25900 [Mesorhizobium sp. B2-7-1]
MELKYTRRAPASILLALLMLSASTAAIAGSLAGSVGDKRFPPPLSMNPKDQCTSAYRSYVAASGHSAYATTFYTRVVDLYVVCGKALNAPSQKAAEDVALRNCQGGLKRWRLNTASGGCAIAASK